MTTSRLFSGRLRKAVLSVGILLAFACGPGLFDENEFLSFFQPESSNAQPQDRLYFFTPQLYDYTNELNREGDDTLLIDENVRAWAAYAGKKVPMTAVAKALYKADDTADNAFNAALKQAHAPALDYLKLAHNADQASPRGDQWTPIPADTARLTQLLGEAQAGYESASDPFLKERYAFQAVKLADQIGNYAQCRTLYDQLVVSLPKKTFISDWALCRHAGATFSTGDTARAIYEFAQVFDRCPSRRPQAEASLRIYGIHFQEGALQHARNDQEKAAIYALCAVQPKQDALPLLKEVVKLTPKNPLIELIMAREINRNEYFFLSESNPIYGYDEASDRDSLKFEDRKKTSQTYGDQLREFALEAATNEQLNDPAFWYTAAAYIAYLSKDFDESAKTLDKAAQAPTTNPALKKQIALQRMLLLAAQTEHITPDTESKLIGYLEEFGNSENFRFGNAFVTVCQQFAQKYLAEASNEKTGGWLEGCSRAKAKSTSETAAAKAFLLTMLTASQLNTSGGYVDLNTDQLVIEDSSSATTVQQVVTFAEAPTATDFDKRLLKLTGFTPDYLYTLLGRRLLAEHRYADAAAAFGKVNPKTWKEEPFVSYFTQNPFEVPTSKRQTTGTNAYNPVQFAQRMAQLNEQVTHLSGDEAAKAYYELGCGAYNLSWFGNSWVLVKRSWSSVELLSTLYKANNKPSELERAGQQLMRNPYYSTTPAKAFFEKAIKAARQPELAAKACFMAAQCEQSELTTRLAVEEVKRGFIDLDKAGWKALVEKLRRDEYGHYFTKLSTDYGQTKFEAEMHRECATYGDFVSQR
ncbi:hypothetical protein [Spirosoma fluminis]